jgi:hypothetical protein
MKKLIYLSIIMLTIVAQVDAKKRKAEVITKAQYGISEQGTSLVLKMDKGKKHNHPLMAIWLADSTGQYIQTFCTNGNILLTTCIITVVIPYLESLFDNKAKGL